MSDTVRPSRRSFLKKATVAATTGVVAGLGTAGAPAVASTQSRGERLRLGFIGVGNRGTQLLHSFMKNRDIEVTALCDVYEPYLHRDRTAVTPRFIEEVGNRIPQMGEEFPGRVFTCSDFREMLDRKDIDAVVIATPDHWHAIQTIMACEAGKDVYVEKPLTATIHEGRRMVEVAERTGRIVQVGLNRRGSTVYRKLVDMVGQGAIGKVTLGRAYRISNMYPDGIGNRRPEAPPKDFNWDIWLGPREKRPFQYNIHPYKFRWWSDFSSQMGNWGVHYMDTIRWLIGERAPSAITAHGGKYVLTDDRTIPDTMEVTFEFKSGVVVVFGIYEASGGPGMPSGEVELRGTKANLAVSSRGYSITPHGPGQFQNWERLAEPDTFRLEQPEDITDNLVRNFIDCVKSRKQPWCTLENGHRATTFAHLANIALARGKRIEWDAESERVTNDSGANDLLHYKYRKPWKLG